MAVSICDICKVRPAAYRVKISSNGHISNLQVCEIDYERMQRSNAFSSISSSFDSSQNSGYQSHTADDITSLLNSSSKTAITEAGQIALEFKRDEIDTEHLLYSLANDDIVQNILKQFKLKPDDLKGYIDANAPKNTNHQISPSNIVLSPRLKQVIELALDTAQDMGHGYIGPEHLLVGLTEESEGMAGEILKKYGLTSQNIRQQITKLIGKGAKNGKINEQSNTPQLDKYSRDLSKIASNGKLDPVIGRSKEIESTIEILARRTKNNPVLIGEPGVGKTAIVEGLAQMIVSGKIPQILENKRVVELNLISMIAGSKYRGEFEERIKTVIDEIVANQETLIVFIDELHTVIGAGQGGEEGGMDISNILKPALARGELHLIGATTLNEYQKYIEKDSALERRFQPVFVPEPTEAQTIEILRGLRDKYEAHHKVKISDEAIVTAVDLSDRYITNRFLPDKAIDLIDQAAARVRIKADTYTQEIKQLDDEINIQKREHESASTHKEYDKAKKLKKKIDDLNTKRQSIEDEWRKQKSVTSKEVSPESVAQIVSSITGIPTQDLTKEEKEKLLQLEERLHERVVGQDRAIEAVADAIRLNRAGLTRTNRPIGSFMFLGPTGVGKTELAKALAWQVFGDESALTRIDMSEYMEKHNTARLIGAPPGYVGYDEGGQLTEKVRRRPYCVLLLDELEKAHPDIQNILLQVLDDGRLTDGKGRVVDFSNTIIIATSNLGSKEIQDNIMSKPDNDDKSLKNIIMPILHNTFRPEFINRWDEIIVFKPLSKQQIKSIVGIQLNKVQQMALGQNIDLIIDETVLNHFADVGYDPHSGARELNRRIRTELENKLAKELLSSQISPNQTLTAKYDNKNIFFENTKQKRSTKIK